MNVIWGYCFLFFFSKEIFYFEFGACNTFKRAETGATKDWESCGML